MALFEVKVSAPGKVILHGEHSVMYGKFAIAGGLGLRTTTVVKEIEHKFINIRLPSVDLQESLPLNTLKEHLFTSHNLWNRPEDLHHEDHLARVDSCLIKMVPDFIDLPNVKKNSLRGFLYILSGIFGMIDNGLNVSIQSELTVGAGTGSSASFAVCVSGALIQLLKMKKGILSKEFSIEDQMLISGWAFNCEKIMHGAPSGIDNSTCTFGSLVGFRKGEKPILQDYQLNLRILLVDTKVSRQTKVLAEKVKSLKEWNGEAVESVMDAMGHVALRATDVMKKLSSCGDEDSIALYQQLSELWNMNHCLLSSLGVSHPSLEDIRCSAAKHQLACKLTGAGGGGYAIVLIPPSTDNSTILNLEEELVNKGYSVRDTQLGAPGVTLH